MATNAIPPPISHPEASPLVANFFSRFAKFEFALKKAGFAEADGHGGVVPKWDAFMGHPETSVIFPALSAHLSASYLVEMPPRKRILKNNILDWSEPPPALTTMAEVGVMLRRVRNNLFHGDKAVPGAERDEQ